MTEPLLLGFILNIAGAAALLIWAVRLVRTGVERGFSNLLRSGLRQSGKSKPVAALTGVAAALFLQSSTAVAVLTSNFVSKGGLAAATGLVILLGADVGSALVTQFLTIKLSLLIPCLLLGGVLLFLRSSETNYRQVGRILIGLALILVSLEMIRDATGPMVDSPGTQAVMAYLGRDLMTSFILGALFAWLVHSSVASVLLFVTLASQSILTLPAAASMVLGANLGGAFIAYVLTLSAPLIARRMIVANLVLRGGGAILVLGLISGTPHVLDYLGSNPATQSLNLHLAFNLALAVLAIPFATYVLRTLETFMPQGVATDVGIEPATALDPSALKKPQRGLDCAARELLSMGQSVEQMLGMVDPLFDEWNDTIAKTVQDQDQMIQEMHLNTKLYLAQLGTSGLEEDLSKRSMELAAVSTSINSASDTISRVILVLAQDLQTRGVQFSPRGRKEIGEFSDRVHANIQLALNVMMNQNPAEARELITAKEKVRKVEQKLQRKHLERLQEGMVESIDTSNIHQETLRALKQVNASFSMIGYPILQRSGDLLKSRLV